MKLLKFALLEMKQERYSEFTCLIACLFMAMGILLVPSAQAVDLLVLNRTTSQVSRYDGQTGAFIDTFVAAGSGGLSVPYGLVVGPDGNLYASSSGSSQILRYDGQTGAFINAFVPAGSGGLVFPEGLVFGPDGNLYVSSTDTDQVLRYDGQTGAFVNAFVPAGSGGLDRPVGIRFGPDGNLYVSSFFTNQVLRYDGQTGAFVNAFVPAGSGGLVFPTGLVFGPDGNLYVSGRDSNAVLRYDGQTGAFIDTFVPAGSGGLFGPHELVFGPDGNLYVCSEFSKQILRYNGQTGAFIDAFVPAGSAGLDDPIGLAFTPTAGPRPVLSFGPSIRIDNSSAITGGFAGLALDKKGKVYAAWYDSRIHEYDIFFNLSTDFGETFGSDYQVGGIGNPTWAVYSSIAADSNNHVYVVWEDLRSGIHVYLNRSDDGGETFIGERMIDNAPETGWPDVACDDNGHVYVSRALHHGSGEIYVDISNDYGQTFNIHKDVSGSVGGGISSIATDGAGKVYVVFSNPRAYRDFYLTRSVDYGNTWETPIALGSLGPRFFDDWWNNPNISVEGHTVYVVWSQQVDNNMWDIYIRKSSDAGMTFTQQKLVNVSGHVILPLLLGLPTSQVAADGNDVYVAWNSKGNNDLSQTQLVMSTDGGKTFGTPIRVDDSSAGGFFNARHGIAAQGGSVYAVWADFRTGDSGQTRFARADLKEIINDLVTFVPITSTYRTTSDTAGCPSGFVGKFSFDARLTNENSSPPISGLIAKVKTLTNGNLLGNADGGNGGVGSTLTVLKEDDYSDGILSPGEFVDVNFSICLKEKKSFTFFVDVLGIKPNNAVGLR